MTILFQQHWLPQNAMRMVLSFCLLLGLTASTSGEDWPSFGHDSFRSNHTSEALPVAELQLAWTYQSPQPPQSAWAGPAKWDAYANMRGLRSMRQYDPVFHASTVGDRVFFGSSVDDSVHCLDAKSGEEIWYFMTDAPVRIAPTVHKGNVYFGSDDGYAYCIRADNGQLVWKFQAVAVEKRLLHNGRFISPWPIRTGVLVGDGTAYFGASLLPWKRSYLCAVDALTGIPQGKGHYVRKLSGELTLEGPLLASANLLVVPQGRIPPQLFQRNDGLPLGTLEGGGGCFVLITKDDQILHGPGNKTGWITQSNMESRAKIASFAGANAMVVADDTAYLLTDRSLGAVHRSDGQKLWQIESTHPYALIKAGEMLLAGGMDKVTAYAAGSGNELWTSQVHGRAYGLAVANGMLLVSTDEGAIHAFRTDGSASDTSAENPANAHAEVSDSESKPPILVKPIRDKSLIGRWVFQRFELEGKPGANDKILAGTKVKDQTGHLAGSIVGEARLAQLGSTESLALDGKTNSVMLTGKLAEAQLPSEQFTAEAWVRIDHPEANGGILGAFQDNGNHERGWLLGYKGQKFCLAVKSLQGNGRLTYLSAARDFELGRWYHVAGTYDGRQMKLWVNGKIAGSANTQKGPIDYPEAAFFEIGAYHDKNEYFRLRGMIHEVRLYRQTLPAAQINRQYRAKKNLFPQSLKFAVEPYLQFDSPHTAIVRWSTKDPSPSLLRVRLGDEFNTIQDAIPKTEHQLGIEVPRHNRIYRYQIEAAVDGVRQLSREYECDTFFNYCVAELPNAPNSFPASDSKNHIASEAKKILAGSKVRQGVCLMLGCTDGQLAYELVRQSKLRVIAVDTDKSRVQALREHFRQAHCYGARVAVHHVESLAKLPWVGAFANLVVSERFMSEGALPGSAAEIMRILRPGGGVACLGQPKSDSKHNSADDLRKWLADSKVEGVNIVSNNRGIWARIVRAPLPGVGEWSHQYGTADNTAFGGETLQGNSNTQDFATHWIGRPGPRAQPDRNGRKPSPLAVNGRLFVQGLHRIIGLDSYNGTILWSQEIPNIERFNLPRDSSNWCADNDFVYVAVGRDCRQINAQTGELVSQRRVADKGNSTSSHQWGYIGRVADKLIGSAIKEGTAFIDFWGGDTAGWYDARSGPVTYKVCSDRLFAMDRSNPGVQWTYEDGVIINSTISGRGNQLYFVECRNKAVKDSDARRVGSKELWQDQFLVALDVSSGKKVWEQPLDTVAGTVVFYMACGEDALVIVASSGEHFHVYAYGRNNGNPIWSNSGGWLEGKGDHGKAMSRPAIVGGEVYVRPWVFDLASGKKLDVPMQGGGCGTYAATSQGLIYRSGNVTLWDRASGNLSSWSRLRPGCWLSTIPASGMVLSPEAGGGCSCGSWLETSVGFMPKLD